MNETWLDKFPGIIPKKTYTTRLSAGEDNGLLVTLDSESYTVTLNFGAVQAVQILDEGGLLNGEDTEQLRFLQGQGFPSTIYEIENGSFARYIEAQMGSDLYHWHNCRQYTIVTLNYVICIVSTWEPEITTASK